MLEKISFKNSDIQETERKEEKLVRIHNRCYRFKFHESISGGNVICGHLCPTKFQLLLPMELGCSVPRDRMENKDLLYRSREPREK